MLMIAVRPPESQNHVHFSSELFQSVRWAYHALNGGLLRQNSPWHENLLHLEQHWCDSLWVDCFRWKQSEFVTESGARSCWIFWGIGRLTENVTVWSRINLIRYEQRVNFINQPDAAFHYRVKALAQYRTASTESSLGFPTNASLGTFSNDSVLGQSIRSIIMPHSLIIVAGSTHRLRIPSARHAIWWIFFYFANFTSGAGAVHLVPWSNCVNSFLPPLAAILAHGSAGQSFRNWWRKLDARFSNLR
jgi:hypothetical protein